MLYVHKKTYLETEKPWSLKKNIVFTFTEKNSISRLKWDSCTFFNLFLILDESSISNLKQNIDYY